MTSWEFFDYLLEKANIVGTQAQDLALMVRDSSVSPRLEHMRIHWKQLNELRICKQLPDRDAADVTLIEKIEGAWRTDFNIIFRVNSYDIHSKRIEEDL